MNRIIAVGDVHGCAFTLQALLDRLAFSRSDTLFLLGDYIDRGPRAKVAMDFIMRLQKDGYDVRCLRGNHEQMLLDGLQSKADWEHWLSNGGLALLHELGFVYAGHQTDESFKDEALRAALAPYAAWMMNLPYLYEFEDYIFVHAGINTHVQNPFEPEPDMLWMRNWYDDINYEILANRRIVHGHTPTPENAIRDMLGNFETRRFINLDNGCFISKKYRHIPGMGNLCAFDLSNRTLYFEQNCDA